MVDTVAGVILTTKNENAFSEIQKLCNDPSTSREALDVSLQENLRLHGTAETDDEGFKILTLLLQKGAVVPEHMLRNDFVVSQDVRGLINSFPETGHRSTTRKST